MSRGFSAAQETALAAATVRPVTFAKLEFGNGIVYVHDSLGTITWDANDWLGVGDFGKIDQVEEGVDTSPYAVRLTLSGLDSNLSNQALSQDYFKRPATLYLGLLDDNEDLIGTPLEVWTGAMDQMTVTVGTDGNDAIQLTAESHLARFSTASNVKYTNEAQQQAYSGDKFFEFTPKVVGLKIAWRSQSSNDGGGAYINPIAPPGESPAFDPMNPYHTN